MSDDSITVPPFVGEPKPEAEARLTTPEKLLVTLNTYLYLIYIPISYIHTYILYTYLYLI